MLTSALKRFIVSLASVSLLSTTFLGVANAAMVGTTTALADAERAEYVSDVRDFLTQEKVQKQLVTMGVDPDNARDRVAAMTNEELRMLHGEIDQLPAGAGLVEVIGVVFIVLLVLELVGITNVFSRF